MGYVQNLTRYFRQSLIDADRTCPDDKELLTVLRSDKEAKRDTPYVSLAHHAWLSGQIASEQAEAILSQRQSRSTKPLVEVELVMFPRVDLLRSQGGARDSRKRQVLLPLGVFLRLDRQGQLRPAAKAPWIPREWLGPNQSAAEPIADVVTVDAFISTHPFEGIETWRELVGYCTRLLCSVAGAEYVAPDDHQPGTSLFELDMHADYELIDQSLLQVEDLPIVGAKETMLKVLDTLGDMAELPPLYRCCASRHAPPLKLHQDLEFDTRLAKQHVGQMTGEFPLSPKQRHALHHFLKQEDGEILAVNGPPGTGKTTLLRSVVANLWTQAALDEAEPPLIVAASNNNQAVINILESFAKVDEASLDERLMGRWLPEVASYGLYCRASDRANDQNPYLYYGPRGEGCMQAWQTREYFERARHQFLQHAGQWQDGSATNLQEVRKALHQAMMQRRRQMASGLESLKDFQVVEQEVIAAYGGIDALQAAIEATREHQGAANAQHERLKSQLDELYAQWERRSLWVCILWRVPLIGSSLRQREHRKTARLLNQWDLTLDDHTDAAVEGWFREQLTRSRETTESLTQALADLQALVERYRTCRETLDVWIARHRPETLHSNAPAGQINEINDRVLRFELFKLATHYWEARWLLELDDFLTSHDADRKSPYRVRRKLRRFAKLTPCFVSTFYMTPSTFMAGEFQDGVWRDTPLLGEIDLLIVDEAGQALPDVSAASFALAKRALVVGDTDQIEPVWSVPASVDRANLTLYNLLEDERSYHDFWLTSGLLASSGNVMRIAQRQCQYHQFPQLPRGLYLTEHRRCYDDIIGYCIALVYQGILEPLRGNPKRPVPWGVLSMVSVEEPSSSYGGSRGNPGEAKRTAQWLRAERENILTYARQMDPKLVDKSDEDVLKMSVGIITPFSKQATLIRTELRRQGIDGLTVGTVHSLQGDERLLVLFSSVYGINDRGLGKFYDRGPNMLNVAVSRAKDSFIVFGHAEVFGTESRGTPSGLLRQRLSMDASTAEVA
jgi:hypothetical protein